jgi:hypothetical protein
MRGGELVLGVATRRRASAPDPPAGDDGDRRQRARWRWIATAGVVAGLLAGVLVVWLPDRSATPPPIAVADVALRGDYVANPGMGWQDMERDDTAFVQSVEYVRPSVGWAGMNPEARVYDWSVIDDAIAEARDRGNQLSLRVYTMRHPEWDGHKVPQWVLDDGAELLADGEPDYSNAVYQEHWATFVEALRRRYDGHPDLAFIDVSGYGNYNEWSWEDQTRWESGWDPGDPAGTLDGQARQRLADLFLGGSGTIEARDADGDVVEVDYDYPGFSRTQLVMPYAGIRQSLWYALDKRPDVGWRYDCLGQISAVDLRGLGDEALSRWRDAPMVYEFCSQVDWSTVDDAVGLTHPVLIHDNSTDEREEVADLLATVGYRYALDSAEAPGAVRAGRSIPVRMWWRNLGSSPAYEALGADLELRVALRDRDGRVLVATPASSDVNGWMPDSAVEVDVDLKVPGRVPAGAYDLAVAVVDRDTGDPIGLAMRDTGGDAWFRLGRVDVEATR